MKFKDTYDGMICESIFQKVSPKGKMDRLRQYPLALHSAAFHGNYYQAKALLELGKEVDARDKRGNTPLMFACYKNNMPMVKLFLDKGADINAKNMYGTGPLKYALEYGKGNKNVTGTDFTLIDYLTKHGAIA
jgi:hypothetical protein